MSFPQSTLITGGLLAVMMFFGTVATVQAGDGCTSDKKSASTASLTEAPAVIL
ncbi:hypothetical protein G3480_03685 [Thiorhodococcus mannitoliphagus]|uniref:Uncharacterized protein n=1 Tax=Thiorhodococcus mannitoliphagus TaxID=329406 RepID=A0A6P1DUP9_9GAMM|nr:hypothetical protein [Thiorhodococcus mannitoliphagus]NEX19424.1 hypothetical protein [Thiorhodococcus mannitoliphagus]